MTPEDQIDAAELALGLLEGEDRQAALERLLADPAFAAEVAGWRERFALLLADYPAVEPPPGLVERIVLPDGSPARPVRRWPWLVIGAAGGALAASIAALVMMPTAPVVRQSPPVVATPRPQPLLAVLVPTEAGERAPVAALVDRADGTVRFTATIVVPKGRAAELWRIGADGVPLPLGLLPAGSRAPTLLHGARLPGENEVLAVSIEPIGGSPTQKPTGPVIATGPLVTI